MNVPDRVADNKKFQRRVREVVIHSLVNEKTWGRVEDTPLLPQLQGARKAGAYVKVRGGHSGTLAMVSERNKNYQTRTIRKYVYIPL